MKQEKWNLTTQISKICPLAFKMADFLFINNGTIEEFNQKIQGVLNEIIKK